MEKGRLETPTGVFMPVEIEVKNYRSYRDELFSYDGISFATINGENGAGKSSLFMDAMLDALFEEPREGDLTGWICNDPDARSGSIKFTFYLGDKLYRVTRTRTKSGKATLNLSEYVDESWQNRSAEKYRDTQAIIENTIGMDSLTLKATGLIMQDQYGLFLQADKADRMAILGNILGLGIYDRMESMAANRAADANRELRRIADLQEETGRAMPDKATVEATMNKTAVEKASAVADRAIHTKAMSEAQTKLDIAKQAQKRSEKLASIEAQLSDVKKYIELEKLLPAAEAKKSAAQTRLTELLTYAEKTRTAIDGINAEILTLAKAQADVDELKEQYAEADAALTVDNIRIEELDQQAGHSRRQMEEIETAEAKLEVLRRQATEQGQLAAGYEELKRAFSQDGIPHNIVRSIVPLFEATATSIIGQMSGGHMSIEMRMEKTLKSNSKKEVTALDVIVNDAATGALPYMSRSGGERVKAALSVILALAELKSSTAGVQLGFLFIDEPPFLDDKGVQAYCDALEAIQKRYSSLKIMAITHDPEMKARFPQAVDVVKTAEGSKVIYS